MNHGSGYVERRMKNQPNLDYCQLESRQLLANIAVQDAYLVEYGGVVPQPQAVIGQQIALRVDWVTTDLPADIAEYQVEFRIDGVPRRSSLITNGAGQSSSDRSWWHFGWYATDSVHNVEIIVDVDNTIVEDDETDNSIQFQLEPVPAFDLPQPFVWPLDAAPFVESMIWGYADVDPTSGVSDWTGGIAAYNTHDGLDAGPRLAVGMDRNGMGVLAAADGVVTELNEGEYDRQLDGQHPSNYVIIDHGNDWETWYYHLRRDSVNVQVGDLVSQGDLIGIVGNSGNGSNIQGAATPHVHFETKYRGNSIETFIDPDTYWVDAPDYIFDETYLIHSSTTNYDPTGQFYEGPSETQVFDQSPSQLVYTNLYLSGIRENDLIRVEWYRPDGGCTLPANFLLRVIVQILAGSFPDFYLTHCSLALGERRFL